MQIEFLDRKAPGWQHTQDHIASVYRATYGAKITEFAPLLVSVRRGDGQIICAAGLRTCRDGFFSERYLRDEFSTVLQTEVGIDVAQREIMEVVSLASSIPFPVLPMLDAIIAWGRNEGMTCGVFTATRPLRRPLKRTGLSYRALAAADISRVAAPNIWGSYYDADPWGCAFSEPHAQPVTLSPRWRTLTSRSEALTTVLDATSGPVAIGLAGGIDYVIADLATTLALRRQVPLPFFFSGTQTAHILMDGKVTTVITPSPELFHAMPHLALVDPSAPEPQSRPLRPYRGGADRVIYTTGSSGTPKGVIIGDRQISASVTARSAVIGARADDIHLSVLPLAQLLEQICGICLPILAGAKTVFRFEATKTLFGAPITALQQAFCDVCPTTSLLAPAILSQWADALAAQAQHAPDSLRFVAVGGAATAPAVLAQAMSIGIPVHEGYGLSECCAVVAINRPGANRPGTVGPALDGVQVSLDDGEIIVRGATVMSGYLNGAAAPHVWRTGDMGHFDGDHLVVDGRKDALLITGAGRNISPEWVEQRVNVLPHVKGSALGLRSADGVWF